MFVIRITLLIWSFNFNSPSTVTWSYPARADFLVLPFLRRRSLSFFHSGSRSRFYAIPLCSAHTSISLAPAPALLRPHFHFHFIFSHSYLCFLYISPYTYYMRSFSLSLVKASCKHAERLCKLAHHYHLHLYSSNDSHLLYFEVTVAFGCIFSSSSSLLRLLVSLALDLCGKCVLHRRRDRTWSNRMPETNG